MAKKSSIEKNNRRRKMAKQYAGKRARLKAIAQNKSAAMEERFEAQLKLAAAAAQFGAHAHPQPLRGDGPSACLLPQDQDVASCASRARPQGLIPGMVKSSW